MAEVGRAALIIVGSYVGGPIGASIGAAVGTLLFPGELPDVEGPRVSDLRVTASTYGKSINRIYSVFRADGNIIWAPGLVEHEHVKTEGGKGGPTRTSTTYSYTGSFAVSLCRGEVLGVRRIWADAKVIYSVSATASTTAVMSTTQAGAQIYTGSETQAVDPTIQTDIGVDDTPSNKGLCSVVFANMELEKYGNRLPSITAEVVEAPIPSLASVITDVCMDSGLAVADIDVSNLTDTVAGFVIPQAMSGAVALQPLLDAYNVIIHESDWVLVFTPALSITPEAIDVNDFGAGEKGVLDITRGDLTEMPRRTEVTYYEVGTDYQQANQFAQRVLT